MISRIDSAIAKLKTNSTAKKCTITQIADDGEESKIIKEVRLCILSSDETNEIKKLLEDVKEQYEQEIQPKKKALSNQNGNFLQGVVTSG